MEMMTTVEMSRDLLGYGFMPHFMGTDQIERLAQNLRLLLGSKPELSDVELIHEAAEIFYIFFTTWPNQCKRCGHWS